MESSIHEERLSYEADGLNMHSLLYVDPALEGPLPSILVFPEAFGLGEHAKSRARRLASLGYLVLASDLHGEGRIIDDLETARSLVGALRQDPALTRARAGAALEALRARPEADPERIAAIGYCFGGTMALELARGGAGIRAVVGFHSGLATVRPDDAVNIKARILVCIGADDPGIDSDQRSAFVEEMRNAGIDWQMHLYGGVVHSFTNPAADRLGRPDFARYDAKADSRSWAAMLGLFDEVFGAAS